ncbi:5-hydroxytryptamine receptor 3A isoform X1 [Esox lucius]|uniref:5-hydroxytryptamine receptor 3A isoform X1 n=1 Tax=Esox lucius TaxID=8010 RepID=UPI00147754CC|nr:5-hydroxytryptamine receptor 3A isoform X1 [Esox lucius]
MVISLLETVFITNIQCSSSNYPAVPRWLRLIVLDYLARLVHLYQPLGHQHGKSLEVKLQPDVANHTPFEAEPPSTLPPMVEPILVELRQLCTDLEAIRTQIDKHFLGNENTSEWVHIGKVLDRLLFLLHIVFISVSFITIICVWSLWYRLVPGKY